MSGKEGCHIERRVGYARIDADQIDRWEKGETRKKLFLFAWNTTPAGARRKSHLECGTARNDAASRTGGAVKKHVSRQHMGSPVDIISTAKMFRLELFCLPPAKRHARTGSVSGPTSGNCREFCCDRSCFCNGGEDGRQRPTCVRRSFRGR